MGLPPPYCLIWLGTSKKREYKKNVRQLTPVPSGNLQSCVDAGAVPPGGGGSNADPPGEMCSICERKFTTKRGLSVHIARSHKTRKDARQEIKPLNHNARSLGNSTPLVVQELGGAVDASGVQESVPAVSTEVSPPRSDSSRSDQGCRRNELNASATIITQEVSPVQDKASPVVPSTGARPKVTDVRTTQLASTIASRSIGEMVSGLSPTVAPDFVPQCDNSMAQGGHLLEGSLVDSPTIALESPVDVHSSTGMNAERPCPPRLMDLMSDSSDEDGEPQHHTCKDCGRAFSSLVGLSQHRRHAHFNAYNADIVIHRVKPRWSKEESYLLAKKEVELIRGGVKNLNQELHRYCKARTFDSIKSHRRNAGYKKLVQELLGDSAVSKPQSPHIHTPPPGWGVEGLVDSRQACLNEIRRLVSTASPRSYSAPVLWEIGKRLLDGKNIGMELNNYIRQNFYRERKSPPKHVSSAAVPTSNRKKRKQEFAQLQELFRKDQARAARQVLDGQMSCQVDDPDSFLSEWKRVMESRCDEPRLPRPTTDAHRDRNPMGPVTAQDIKGAFPVANSSPGPDGFTVKELRCVPVVILQLLLNILLVQKRLPISLCSARTVFIPKVDGATSFSQFRPITVAPVILRLLHKILANRLQAMALLDCRQRAFIPVDGCGENVHLLGTVLHEARRKRRALFMASVDIAKAFDSVTLDALVVALQRKGIAEEFVEYIRQFYELATTVLSFQDRSLLVRPSRGVRQGDPMSPILFNLVVDEFLAEHCGEEIAFVSANALGELNVSGMAFADDLIVFASTPQGLQHKLLSLTRFLSRRGLKLNPSKCLSLAMIPAGKEKLVKIDPTFKFYIDNVAIPAAAGETEWRYLGISFSARGTRARPVHNELKMYLENVRKAALKPQQRLVVLRFYLLPRLYHRLILGPVSRKHLMRLDKIIRSSVRDWLKLPHDVPLGAFHARVPHGGLGIPSLRTAIPYLRLRRLNALALSEYGACKEAHKMKYIQDLVRQSEAMLLYKGSVINSKKANQKFWTNYFLGSADGAALKEVDNAPGASAWVAEGTRFLSGREFINAIRVRFNTVPTLTRLKRGQGVTKLCRAGCDQEETLGHILQKCHRTHNTRIQRHDMVVKYVAKRSRELGFTVLEEPHYKTSTGVKIPDLVLRRDGQVLVLDAQVVGTRIKLSDAHVVKTSKYMDHELCWLVSKDRTPIVSTITLSYRGVWAKESVNTLKDLGFIANDFKIITIRCLQGGWRCFATHQRMTTAVCGRRRGRVSACNAGE